jgi:ATP-dependent RNA helicase DOB1
LKKAEIERDGFKIEREEEIEEYWDLRKVLQEKGDDFRSVITHPTYSLPFLNTGRLVEIKDGERDYGWGVVVAYNKITAQKVSCIRPEVS